MKRLLILIFLSTIFSLAYAQEVNEKINSLTQERIHVMTDAELYAPGDTLWMRIWLQDGVTLKQTETGSQFVYVDLYDKKDQRHSRIKIKKREDKFTGYMILPKTLVSGDYTLCAYTQYLSHFSAKFLYRKNIHVLTEKDQQIGFKPRPLAEGYLPHAEPLEVLGTKVYPSHSSDTLSIVEFEVPHNTWMSISVTDDQVSPVDTATSLVNMLLKVPSFSIIGSEAQDSLISQLSGSKEQQDFVYGRIINPNNEQFEIYLINLKTGKLYRTFSSVSDGTFMFAEVDIPEGSIFDLAVYYKGKDCVKDVDLFAVSLPDLISHLPSDERQYYVNELIDKIKRKESESKNELDDELKTILSSTQTIDSEDDEIRMIEFEYDKYKRRERDLKNIVKRQFYVDDSYTRYASQSIYANKFPHGASEQNINCVMKDFPRVSIIDSIPMYLSETGKLVPIRLVVGEREIPFQFNSEGKMVPLIETFMPCGFVYAVDFISTKDAQRYFPSKQFPNSPIIRLDIFRVTDPGRMYSSQRILSFERLGYQPPMLHNNLKVRPDVVHTRYWNPAIYTAESDTIRLELPLPLRRRTSYTLRADGITPEGELVSIIRRICL